MTLPGFATTALIEFVKTQLTLDAEAG